MKNYKINIIFYNTSTHFIVLYPNRTQRHLKNPYKAHKYRLCRDLPFYLNSSHRRLIPIFLIALALLFVTVFAILAGMILIGVKIVPFWFLLI